MENLTKLTWGLATILIISCGLYYTFRLTFIQFHLPKMFASLRTKHRKNEISTFQTLMMALAARIGVGSLAGVALAILVGGPGSIFWMVVTSLIAIPNAFAESVLGGIYRKKDFGNVYRGGPAYYIEEGLAKKKVAILYAFLVIVAYILGFITIQANTIVTSINEIITITPILIGLFLAFLSYIVIYKDVKNIAKVSSQLVPIMGVLYLGVCLFIMITNYDKILPILNLIVTNAFQKEAVVGGVLGKFIIGLQRGIFSNEAGLGTGAIAAATSNNHPVEVGYAQMLGIYITTFLICTLTAFVILSSNYETFLTPNLNGIEITQRAFTFHIGSLGNIFVMLVILLFAFSTIITGYYYGESNLKYFIKHQRTKRVKQLKIITVILVVLGSILPSTFLWQIVDFFVSILAIINIYALFLLRNDVIYEWKYYHYTKSK